MSLYYKIFNADLDLEIVPQSFASVEDAETYLLDAPWNICMQPIRIQAFNEDDIRVDYLWRNSDTKRLTGTKGVTLKDALAYQRVWILNVMRGLATSDQSPQVDVIERVGKQQRVIRTYHRALRELVKELGL